MSKTRLANILYTLSNICILIFYGLLILSLSNQNDLQSILKNDIRWWILVMIGLNILLNVIAKAYAPKIVNPMTLVTPARILNYTALFIFLITVLFFDEMKSILFYAIVASFIIQIIAFILSIVLKPKDPKQKRSRSDVIDDIYVDED